MISGMPRNRSTYAVASGRTGQKTGPRSVRMHREEQAEDRDEHRATSHDPDVEPRGRRARPGRTSTALSESKKVAWTRGQPGRGDDEPDDARRRRTTVDARRRRATERRVRARR